MSSLANVLKVQGDYSVARGYYQHALEMRQSLYPKERYRQGHPLLATSLDSMGLILEEQGHYGEARGTSSGRWR